MYWKTKVRDKPVRGDVWVCRRVAWWPKKLMSGYTVWLQYYYQRYEYQVIRKSMAEGPYTPHWNCPPPMYDREEWTLLSESIAVENL